MKFTLFQEVGRIESSCVQFGDKKKTRFATHRTMEVFIENQLKPKDKTKNKNHEKICFRKF